MSVKRVPSSAGSAVIQYFDDQMEDIYSVLPVHDRGPRSLAKPIACPCCNHPVHVPTVDLIITKYEISDFQARILRAVWRGKGSPVQTHRIFDAMYEDDPDGGPDIAKMYEAFKLGLFRLRHRLEGSGVRIENVGYRRGWRLVLEGNE